MFELLDWASQGALGWHGGEWTSLLYPLCRWGNWGVKQLSNLLKICLIDDILHFNLDLTPKSTFFPPDSGAFLLPHLPCEEEALGQDPEFITVLKRAPSGTGQGGGGLSGLRALLKLQYLQSGGSLALQSYKGGWTTWISPRTEPGRPQGEYEACHLYFI